MLKKRYEIISTILIVLIIIFAGLISVRFFTRADMTENKVYTISDVSKNLFSEIDERVHITYFRSEKLSELSPIPGQVEDLLFEYAAFSRGKIAVEVTDPAEEAREQEAESLGLVPQQIEVVERNERSLALIYSGIVIRYLDNVKALPFVTRIESLEYELTTSIRELIEDRERSVGIVIGDLDRTLDEDYALLKSGLQEQFTVSQIPIGDPIPEDMSAVIVAGNKDISNEGLEAIDSYIMNGGSVCFLAESININLQANLVPNPIGSNPLLDMLETYGVHIDPDLVLDSYHRDFRLPARMFGNIAWQIIGPYPHWIAVLDNNVSRDNPVTARFAGLDLMWANPVTLSPPAGVEAEALVKTSEEAWLMKDNFSTNPYQAEMYSFPDPDTEGQYILGAVLDGTFPSQFSQNSSEPTRIMVIGDTDFVTNILQYSDSPYNINFMQNAVEWLTNDDDLISIKTRNVRDVRLNKIADQELKRRAYLFSIIVNVVVIPVIIIFFGVRRVTVRRKRQYKTEE